MAKLLLGALATTIAATAIFATSAHAITNSSECENEGGSWMTLTGGDYCLVPIRDEEFRDEIYDGNRLGVSECPGDTRHNGVYCMYPVNIRPKATPVAATPVDFSETASVTPDASTSSGLVDSVVNDVVDTAVDKAIDAAQDKAGL